MERTRVVKILLALGLSLSLSLAPGCGKKDAEQVQEAKIVLTEAAKIDKVSRYSELSGTLQPIEDSLVSFEASGRIVEMNYKEGDTVSSGSLMARLDAAEYSVQVAQARAGLDKAQVNYEKARDDFERMNQLFNQGALSKNDFENAQNRYIVAEKDYILAQESHSLVTGSGSGKDGLRAPISGTVISKLSSVGQLVDTRTPVYKIGQVDNLKVVLPVPDREITKWKVGDAVSLSLYQDTREGKVTRLFPAVSQGTGAIGVEVTVSNPKHDWFPGQVVKAKYVMETKEGLFVPVEAVLNHGLEKPYVFIASVDKAVKTAVTIGDIVDNRLEILSGINQGDLVIVKGADKLFDGNSIKQAEVAGQ
ncbi:MAG: efflux RND transporter periplasmic adaptor subunit [Bacillota bacterium]